MAIPSRQIGWSTKANLLWQISKQLEYLTCVTAGGCGTTTTTSTIAPTTTTAPVYTFQSAFSDTSNSNACIDPNYEPIIYSLSENLSIGTQVFQDPLLEQAAFDGWYSVSGIVYHITGGNGFISELGTPCNDIIINVPNRFVDCPSPCPSACAEPQNYFDVYMTVACQQEFPNVGCAIWLNIEGTVAFPDGSYSNGNNGCIYIVNGLISSP